MKVFNITGPVLRSQQFSREPKIYKLLNENPELLEKNSQFRLLKINKRSEKGPDFIAINKKGHLIVGEIKAGTLPSVAVKQLKGYAIRFSEMRKDELDREISGHKFPSLRKAYKGFLPKKAQTALLNPSRRRLQLVLVAERFSDKALKEADLQKLPNKLRKVIKDIKCLQLQLFRNNGAKVIAVGEVISGNNRRLSK